MYEQFPARYPMCTGWLCYFPAGAPAGRWFRCPNVAGNDAVLCQICAWEQRTSSARYSSDPPAGLRGV